MKNNNRVALIGSGFVGEAAGRGFHEKGNDVFFFDINKFVIAALQQAGFKADHISRLDDTSSFFDFLLLSLPTPTIGGHTSLEFLKVALTDVGKYLKGASNYPVIVVRSTVPPGTTEDLVISILEKKSGKKIGRDFGVCMNPEFLREATAKEDFARPWIIVIGSNDERSRTRLHDLYAPFKSPIVHMSIKEAEMTKYVHNLLNATKISFFNEMRAVNEMMGIDSELEFKTVVKSAEAIWNPEYGTKDFGPFGGSCLPKDTSGFFSWVKDRHKMELPVLKGTIETNEWMKKNKTVEAEKGVKNYPKMLGVLKIKKLHKKKINI